MPHRPPVRIVIADDHALVRSGLVALMADVRGVEVVGECSDGHELVACVAELAPDIVITDISMPGMDGIRALRLLRERDPTIRVLVLSMYDSAEFVREAIAAGACGFLLKDSAVVELALALDAIRDGHTWLSPRISSRVLEDLRRHGPLPPQAPASTASLPREGDVATLLTARQLEILCRIGRGQALKQIAFDLGLSVKTVETHRSVVMDRLGIRSTAGLVLFAVRNGLVPQQPG